MYFRLTRSFGTARPLVQSAPSLDGSSVTRLASLYPASFLCLFLVVFCGCQVSIVGRKDFGIGRGEVGAEEERRMGRGRMGPWKGVSTESFCTGNRGDFLWESQRRQRHAAKPAKSFLQQTKLLQTIIIMINARATLLLLPWDL